MTRLQLEALTLRIVDQVQAGQPVEDSHIELKAEWPSDPQKAARRIGGHANEAKGQPIVWLIGINETTGEVPGVDRQELATWWDGVCRYFDEEP